MYFILYAIDEFIEAGGIPLPILGKGRRIIRDTFRFNNRRNIGDLTLDNIAIVKGFPVNIVLEVLLRKGGI